MAQTPTEKAKELVEKFMIELMHRTGEIANNRKCAKACALICVSEIINADPMNPYNGGYYETMLDRRDEVVEYYNKVKTEIILYE